MNSKPSVAAAGGTGARPSTPSQNGPDRPFIVPPSVLVSGVLDELADQRAGGRGSAGDRVIAHESASGCAGVSSWRWTITSNHRARVPPAMKEPGPRSGKPRVLTGECSQLRTDGGAGVRRSTANWPRPAWARGYSNQSVADGGRAVVPSGPRLTVPESPVKPIDT